MQVGKRSAGDFAIALAMTALTAAGSSGRWPDRDGGGVETCAHITARSSSR